MSEIATQHEQHKARQLRLKQAALKIAPPPAPPLPPPEPTAEPEEIIPPKKRIFPNTFEATLYEVCRYYDVRERDVLSHRNIPAVVRCRHIIAYILYDITNMTNPQIGHRLNRDPTTVWYAIQKIRDNLEEHREDIEELESRIKTALHKDT